MALPTRTQHEPAQVSSMDVSPLGPTHGVVVTGLAWQGG